MALDDIQEQFDDNEAEAMVDETQPEADATSEAPVETEQTETESQEAVAENQAEAEKPAEEEVKTVPYAALHEERMARKELQAQLNDVNQKLGMFQGLREELNELRKGQNTQSEEARRQQLEEEFENDPIAALRKQNEELQAKIEQEQSVKEQQTEQEQQAQAQQEQFQTMMRTVASQVAEFEESHPDYSQAFQFLMDKRIEEYRAIGITSPQEIQMEFDREAIALSANALQRGVNPGQAVYDLAKSRGYTKSEGLDGVEDPVAKTTLEESMERLEKGASASKTLTGGSGGKPEGSLSVAEIEKMSDAEFDKLWDEMSGGGIYG